MPRQPIVIDWPKVDAMCQIQCTGEEIASVLGISYDTLERACKREKEKGCAEYIAEKKQGGKASLRRRQWQAAQDGNPTMLIWLGKQYLGQRDSFEDDGQSPAPPLNVTFEVKAAQGDIKITNAGS